MKQRFHPLLIILFVSLFVTANAMAQTDSPTIQAILFYSPTCPHCHTVINETLLPMQEEYGEQLQILAVDTSQETGGQLYQAAIEHFEIPQERLGVPTLIIADTILVGSLEIPTQFPGLVADGLEAGGAGWPEIPELQQFVPDLAESAESKTTMETAVPTPTENSETAVSGIQTNLPADTTTISAPPDGSGLAWFVMIIMVVSLGFAGFKVLTTRNFSVAAPSNRRTLTIFLLVIAGLIVSIYLAYIEISHTEAVCGPVGDCNTVQTSDYAQIFGIPIAVLGALNYLAIGLLWISQQYAPNKQRQSIWRILVGLIVFGTIFSIYLTWLELFVIHAICAWCLTSAVVTAVLLIIVIGMMGKLPDTQQPTGTRTAVS